MELFLSHRSVRSFKDESVSDEILDSILHAGVCASNTGNMQLYSVIVTRDAAIKKKMAPFHFNQPMVNSAPVLLTVCFDINRFYKWCRINQTSTDFNNLLWLLTGCVDVSIFTQNVCLAAENFGLGICYLGTVLYNAKEIGEVLRLPIGVIPMTSVVLGYPSVIPEKTDRLPLSGIVHYEQYQDYSDSAVRQIYQQKEMLDSSQKFVSENRKDNLAQVYAEVRYKAADNQFFSKKLYQMLVEQGFVFETE